MKFPFRKPLTVPPRSYAVATPPDPALLLDCTMGVNPYGYPEAAAWAIRSIDLHHLQDYPHDTCLYQSVCSFWQGYAKLTEDMLFFSDGSVSGVYCLNNLFAQSVRNEIVGFFPTFTDMVESARRFGFAYRGIPMRSNEKGRAAAEDLLDSLSDKTAFIYLDRPNNPTGQTMPLSDIRQLCCAAESAGAYCVIDEAYGDFLPREESAMTLLDSYDNLIIIRTFSKGFGLANLRAGYLVLQPELAAMLRQCSNPYVLSDIQRQACSAALTEPGFPISHASDFSSAKRKITEKIGTRIQMLQTDGRVPICTLMLQEEGDLQRMLMEKGIYALSGCDFEGLDARYVRLCMPVQQSLSRLTDALEALEKDSC
ncbi:MAG: aminotransferase class I/II-fold pyridoxal phosphate-dependent enzyme [Oscillospiraceae bacterium]|nr:aminotransferase class I/II-fold pyridoxal phosphate-dependent enzyme [Oscillospiraceae bacterium]